LENAGISHCQWKSNEHLAEALTGLTDIDLLVDKAQAARCEAILAELSFKRFQSQPWARYPGIEDWIGFDSCTGRLVHVHLHYQLLAGAKHLKEHHIPWEKLVLDTAIKDPVYGVCITHPNVELLLLIARIALKSSRLRIARASLGRALFPEELVREFNYLLGQADRGEVLRYAGDLLGVECSKLIEGILRRGTLPDARTTWRLRSLVGRALKEHRRYSGPAIALQVAQKWVHSRSARALRKFRMAGQAGKRLHSGGAVIAVVGSDGAGKSAVSQELQRWLSWKIDTQKVYFGTGDGPVIAPIKVAKRLARAGSRGKAGTGSLARASQEGERRKPFVREIGSRVLGLTIALDRRRKARWAARVRLNGGIVVADRYPQNQFPAIFDGPRTRGDGENASRVGRFLSQRELQVYSQIERFPPDIVLKLHVPVDIAQIRKPDHSLDEILQKAVITNALEFPSSHVINIDASEPLDCVLLAAKRRIWESL
jgi:thymidylate kinase